MKVLGRGGLVEGSWTVLENNNKSRFLFTKPLKIIMDVLLVEPRLTFHHFELDTLFTVVDLRSMLLQCTKESLRLHLSAAPPFHQVTTDCCLMEKHETHSFCFSG